MDGAEVNRPYGQGPALVRGELAGVLGCRIAGLARPELLVEVEVAAVKGARAGIEWIGPDAVDPLDALRLVTGAPGAPAAGFAGGDERATCPRRLLSARSFTRNARRKANDSRAAATGRRSFRDVGTAVVDAHLHGTVGLTFVTSTRCRRAVCGGPR